MMFFPESRKEKNTKSFHPSLLLKSRKGDKVISVYWFFILFLVAAAIVYMVFLFYGKPYDVREVEANLLANKISDCLAYGGMINEQVLTEEYRMNFEENCGLDFRTEDSYGWNNDQIYFIVSIYDFKSEELKYSFSSQRFNWIDSCGSKKDNNPFCVRKELYVLDGNGNNYLIDIFTAVRKTEKNVN
ncbi:MAG: hypothetical protein AABW50_03550 [Nanoarchaeota archaeon]